MKNGKLSLIKQLVSVIHKYGKRQQCSRWEILEHFPPCKHRTINGYLGHAYGYLERAPGNSVYTLNPRTPLIRADGISGRYTFSLNAAGWALAERLLET